MNKDFHYYATYYAARIAGYVPDHALIIANAAQFVDDFDFDKFKKVDSKHKAQTVQQIFDAGTSYNSTLNNIWLPFHFLPGNDAAYYKSLGSKLPDNFLNLLVRPDSRMANDMFEQLKAVSNREYFLIMTGMLIHIFCDTWAHQDFAGCDCKALNDYSGKVIDLNMKKEIDYRIIWGESYSPSKISNTGHARLGSICDYPFMKYTYQPAWSNRQITKDNTANFVTAFRRMVEKLREVRTGELYKYVNDLGEIANIFKTYVDYSSANKYREQTYGWKTFLHSKNEDIPDYNDKLWMNAYKDATNKSDTFLYKFAECAFCHHEYVAKKVNMNLMPPKIL